LTLVDTSVWIDHLRAGIRELESLLDRGLVATHPFVIGELACGSLRGRKRILADLACLPIVNAARHDEVLHFVTERHLWGKGVGWIDAHLLASAVMAGCSFWTRDRRLAATARSLGVRV
jgi:predicted nucleic acid-binding protein